MILLAALLTFQTLAETSEIIEIRGFLSRDEDKRPLLSAMPLKSCCVNKNQVPYIFLGYEPKEWQSCKPVTLSGRLQKKDGFFHLLVE
jgi:hypothetical protein